MFTPGWRVVTLAQHSLLKWLAQWAKGFPHLVLHVQCLCVFPIEVPFRVISCTHTHTHIREELEGVELSQHLLPTLSSSFINTVYKAESHAVSHMSLATDDIGC